MGFKTIGIYITTTFISVSIGLILVNSFNPGDGIQYNYNVNLINQVESKEASVKEAKERGPLQPIIDIVPDNIFKSATSNKNMLQIVFVSILLGIGLLGIPKDRSKSIISAIDIKFIAKYPIKQFFRGISKAQLLAFSTSSSGATLPVTMDCCEKNLGVKKEVSSFVLPIGATVNMDGTALYQSVAAVFIAQATGIPLDIYDQISIIVMTVIASIGTAAVPSAGIVMLIIILDTIGIGGAGVALIIGVDRILDMLRTTTNVTGDAAVALTINQLEKS